jgi:hypothetical protein
LERPFHDRRAEADGDPDAGALEFVAIVVASGLALGIYAIAVGVVELAIRKASRRSSSLGE